MELCSSSNSKCQVLSSFLFLMLFLFLATWSQKYLLPRSDITQIFSWQQADNLTDLSSNSPEQEEFTRSLTRVLNEAARRSRGRKCVLLVPLNNAWAAEGGLFDYFLASFHENHISDLLDHMVVVAMDDGAFNRCRRIHRHCFQLRTEGIDFSSEKMYMSEGFIAMSKMRVSLQTTVLQLGFDFIFSDADMVWFRRPFQHFSQDADFEISCDGFNGNSTDLNNAPNTGFYHVHSNPRTIQMFKRWEQLNAAHPDLKDQDVFYILKGSAEFLSLRIRLKFLSPDYFSGFCQKTSDLEKVCTMHANCCGRGAAIKLEDLRLTMDDWRLFKSMTPQESRERGIHFTAPKACL